MRIIEGTDDLSQARIRERYWITEYLKRGYPLLNIVAVPVSMATTTRLRSIREEIGATQEAVARRTHLGLRTYIRAEGGQRVTYATANQLLKAINSFLVEAGKPEVTLDQLGLTLY